MCRGMLSIEVVAQEAAIRVYGSALFWRNGDEATGYVRLCQAGFCKLFLIDTEGWTMGTLLYLQSDPTGSKIESRSFPSMC